MARDTVLRWGCCLSGLSVAATLYLVTYHAFLNDLRTINALLGSNVTFGTRADRLGSSVPHPAPHDHLDLSTQSSIHDPNRNAIVGVVEVRKDALAVAPHSCSAAQIAVIRTHLPPDECVQNQKRPWNRKCSFSAASCCPQNIWLRKFYERVHTDISSPRSFVGLSVGCNRGDDAINLMRLGSADPSFDTDRWSAAFFANSSSMAGEVCGQALPQVDLGNFPPASVVSQMHCIDPLEHNANALRRSAHELGLDTKGFHVHQIAVSRTNGAVLFPSAKATQLGTENKGISNCKQTKVPTESCESVEMYNLDTFDQKFLKPDAPINILSIDVEGFDGDVLLGATEYTLPRVQYLEFEYNWMGSWQGQKLSDVIELLDSKFGFTCYWPGNKGQIWRITGCWQEHYNLHFWSNVACVNRNYEAVKELANIMEEMFLHTLENPRQQIS